MKARKRGAFSNPSRASSSAVMVTKSSACSNSASSRIIVRSSAASWMAAGRIRSIFRWRISRAPAFSVKRGGAGSDANPVSVLQQPGVDEAFVSCISLAAFDAFHAHHACRDRNIIEHMHVERLGCDLLLLAAGLRRGRFHAGQKLGFGLHRTVVVHENDGIVENEIQRLGIP